MVGKGDALKSNIVFFAALALVVVLAALVG
jgi:hypothetical protein